MDRAARVMVKSQQNSSSRTLLSITYQQYDTMNQSVFQQACFRHSEGESLAARQGHEPRHDTDT